MNSYPVSSAACRHAFLLQEFGLLKSVSVSLMGHLEITLVKGTCRRDLALQAGSGSGGAGDGHSAISSE